MGFDDPPVPRAAGAIAGCIVAAMVALVLVFFLLSQVGDPEPRFDGIKDPPRLEQSE